MSPRLTAAWLIALLLLTGCSWGLPDPVELDSSEGVLDLTAWNFSSSGTVKPMGWNWDADVLWSPGEGGRPGLGAASPLGPPELGGSLPDSLKARSSGEELAAATFWLTVLVPQDESFGLQVGAIPGAFQVWVNGCLVWESGVVSTNPRMYQADGSGTVLSVQPLDGRLEIVVPVVTRDPLVRHTELNRHWILGPAKELLASERAEENGRVLQVTFVALSVLLFLGLALLRPGQRALVPFVVFLVLCLLKLLFNVEQPESLLNPVVPGLSPSVYLYLNHGLNLLPFPLLVLFLVRQFPQDVGFRAFLVIGGVTVLSTLWELLPLVVLSLGGFDLYVSIMKAPWAFVLNLYVVLVTLYIFERLYHVRAHRRPLSGPLFFGGIGIGLIILLPVPLSYFLPVKYTLFMGWGLFLFIFLLGSALIRNEVKSTEAELRRLSAELEKKETLRRIASDGWGPRLERDSTEALRPGDHRTTEAVLVQIHSPDPPEHWLPLVGQAADNRQALLAEWREGTGLWVLDSWSETALAFVLEVQKSLEALQGLRYRVTLTKKTVEFRVFEAGNTWLPAIEGLPRARLSELDDLALRLGAVVLLDSSLEDGLVIGGWRRHRHLTPGGKEIELYEAEEQSLAQMKDKTLETYESALSLCREGKIDMAIEAMVAVVRLNPFDQPARAHLAEWGG